MLEAWSDLEGERPMPSGLGGGVRGNIPWLAAGAWLDEAGIEDPEHRRTFRSLLRALDDEARSFASELSEDTLPPRESGVWT